MYSRLLLIIALLSLVTPHLDARTILVTPADALQAVIERSAPGDTIMLSDGDYHLSSTLTIPASKHHLTLMSQNLRGARITTAIDISPKQMGKVSDKKVTSRLRKNMRSKVREIDLKSLGLKVTPFADIFDQLSNFPQLYSGNQALQLSRYPNEGYMTMKRVLDNFGDGKTHGGIFEYSDNRTADWTAAVADGLWLRGFWRVPWQSATVRVKSIDTQQHTVTQLVGVNLVKNLADNNQNNGIGDKNSRPYGSGEEPYYALNLPEEIDLPGEWCVDFTRQKIYIYPTKEVSKKGLQISAFYQPVVIVDNAADCSIVGIVFDHSGQNGIEIRGGKANRVLGCEFKNLSGTGIVIDMGMDHEVRSCDFHHLGLEGILAMGGDRVTLTPCNYLIENNYFHNFAINKDAWAAAVRLGRYNPNGGEYGGEDAVGITVRHNLVHDAPHSAFLYVGNLNVLEYNEIYDIAKKTSDVGAIYTRHDWTARGNVVRHNYIHDIPRANGTYHDDGHAGDSIYLNLVQGAIYGTLIGGGHDNVVINNVYLDCTGAGVYMDARGKNANYTAENPAFNARFKKYRLSEGAWAKRFPTLRDMLKTPHLELPHDDVIEHDIFIDCKRGVWLNGMESNFVYSPRIGSNISLESDLPLAERLEQMRDEQKALAPLGIKIPDIRLSEIGLYVDQYRTQLP